MINLDKGLTTWPAKEPTRSLRIYIMPFWPMNQIKLDLLTKTSFLQIYTKMVINWTAFLYNMIRVGCKSGKIMQVSHKLLYHPSPPIADASGHFCKYGDWNWSDFFLKNSFSVLKKYIFHFIWYACLLFLFFLSLCKIARCLWPLYVLSNIT